MLSALRVGGDSAVEALSAALDHAMDVLEQLSVSSPRKSRRSVLELMDATESLAESIDGAWCDGLSVCSSAELSALADVMASVRGLGAAAVLPRAAPLEELRVPPGRRIRALRRRGALGAHRARGKLRRGPRTGRTLQMHQSTGNIPKHATRLHTP